MDEVPQAVIGIVKVGKGGVRSRGRGVTAAPFWWEPASSGTRVMKKNLRSHLVPWKLDIHHSVGQDRAGIPSLPPCFRHRIFPTGKAGYTSIILWDRRLIAGWYFSLWTGISGNVPMVGGAEIESDRRVTPW